ncbi:MAG TPA: histidine kinase dimerization/phospho-acceptor domain-containing protein [Candidatus Lokiarchaeia archaeon]|nr:histidine kinase dimerization/phospho-acceptor domain-containing protein [Candidatus Lokiarchaeia archaeon]
MHEKRAFEPTPEEGFHDKFSRASHLSHDLLTPLNAILGFAEILLDGVGGPVTREQKEMLEAIRQGGEKLRECLTALLDTLNPCDI